MSMFTILQRCRYASNCSRGVGSLLLRQSQFVFSTCPASGRVYNVRCLGTGKFKQTIEHYNHMLESELQKRFPRAGRVYIRLRKGVFLLVDDAKNYFKLRFAVIRGSKPVDDLTFYQASLLANLPKTFAQFFPIFFVMSIPVIGIPIVIPLAIYSPRIFLTYHFWSDEQKLEYSLPRFVKIVKAADEIYDILQLIKPFSEKKVSSPASNNPLDVLKYPPQLQQSNVKVLEDYTELKNIERVFEYNGSLPIERISPDVLKSLCEINGIFPYGVIRCWQRLLIRSANLRMVNLSLGKPGEIQKLSSTQRRLECRLRGIDLLNKEDQIEFLQKYTAAVKQLDANRKGLTLLLFLPAIVSRSKPHDVDGHGGAKTRPQPDR